MGDVEAIDAVHGKAMKFSGRGAAGDSLGVRFLVNHSWTRDLPLLVRAMVLADKTLFVAGPPDLVDEEETSTRFGAPGVQEKLAAQDAALRGEMGANLWAVSTEDSSKRAELELSSMPIFDGPEERGPVVDVTRRIVGAACQESSHNLGLAVPCCQV